MHGHIPSHTLVIDDSAENSMFEGVRYGLCKACAEESSVNPTYQAAITLELQKRLNKLRENFLN
jgi:hypothetical protein